MASSSKEQELAIKIAGKVENSFKQSLGVTEDGLNKIASVAKKAAAVAAAAFAAVKVGDFISGAVDEYAEFEQAMANTSAIAGASADDYAKLSAAAREAGKATTFTASEAADALGYMALAGWNVEESTAALTPVLKLAEATQADLATTSDQVTDSMSAMGVGIDDLQGYLDVIVTTNNKANTTAADLMDAFIGCGGAARAAGMNYKETSTALGILANNGIKAATGSIVYLDKSSKHMYELNNRIRLINVNEYPVATSQGFIGFICGIISQDHDIETMFLDSFLKLAGLEGEDISETITTLEGISEKYSVNFVLSISMDAAEMPENAQKDVVVSL